MIDIMNYCKIYEEGVEACRKHMNSRWLEHLKVTIAKIPKTLYKSDFQKEIGDIVTLLK